MAATWEYETKGFKRGFDEMTTNVFQRKTSNATTCKERPILFSGPMVRAILEGRKTQTRRVVKPPSPYADGDDITVAWACGDVKCPYGKPGDPLWVREGLRGDGQPGDRRIGIMRYAADGEMVLTYNQDHLWGYKRPTLSAIYMPRWASRILLEVTDVRVERLQEISWNDAKSEGVITRDGPLYADEPVTAYVPQDQYRILWDSINGKKHPWSSNPWVWVVEFKKLESA